MIWIDIGVTVLLTLRIALFRLTHPLLLDPNNDAWSVGPSQLHIHVTLD